MGPGPPSSIWVVIWTLQDEVGTEMLQHKVSKFKIKLVQLFNKQRYLLQLYTLMPLLMINTCSPKQPSTHQWDIVLVAWVKTSKFRFTCFKINQMFWLSPPYLYVFKINQNHVHQLHIRTPRSVPRDGYPGAWSTSTSIVGQQQSFILLGCFGLEVVLHSNNKYINSHFNVLNKT